MGTGRAVACVAVALGVWALGRTGDRAGRHGAATSVAACHLPHHLPHGAPGPPLDPLVLVSPPLPIRLFPLPVSLQSRSPPSGAAL